MTRRREDEQRSPSIQLSQEQLVELIQTALATRDTQAANAADLDLQQRALETVQRLRRVQCAGEPPTATSPDGSARVSRKQGQRILGPYEERAGWRVIEVDAVGRKSSVVFPTQRRAQHYVDLVRAELQRETYTTEGALVAYKQHLQTKGNKPDSIRQTCYLIAAFFGGATPLELLTKKRIEAQYEAMREQVKANGERRFSVDSHRSALLQVRTFLSWCVEKGWLKENPTVGVKGVGKRRPRGKSLGKAGNELRIKQAREWLGMALYRAHRGDEGATAALVACLLGMRASEIVSRRVGDLDTDRAPGDVLWIACTKTPAGRRTLDVPVELRPYLLACAKDKAPAQFLFEAEFVNGNSKPHWRDWIRHNVHRMCDQAAVPRVTAHSMRGMLATMASARGELGAAIVAQLGHANERMAENAYIAPGAKAKGVRLRGLAVLNGGLATSR